jgi:hypothetical protein
MVPEDPELSVGAEAFAAAVRDQILHALERRQWTVADLGTRTQDISPSALEAYARGERDLDIFQLGQIFRVLDLEQNTVFRNAYEVAHRQQGDADS